MAGSHSRGAFRNCLLHATTTPLFPKRFHAHTTEDHDQQALTLSKKGESDDDRLKISRGLLTGSADLWNTVLPTISRVLHISDEYTCLEYVVGIKVLLAFEVLRNGRRAVKGKVLAEQGGWIPSSLAAAGRNRGSLRFR
ncbi:hypothetical protein J6590_027909 [Homalodisca vitripennis]|nr:hypothetical protein J6590_027909 [Homalodisca vitripennis]